jgi:gamma-glutamyltranspeptidase/glutathione hydrolase
MKPTFLRWVAIAALMAGGTFSVAANPPAAPPVSYGVEEDVFHPVRATHGMVASVDALATRVGVDILRQGGNAVDAAVAVGYALAVTHPQAGNLGGGGFMMLRTKDGKTTAIDFREMAPSQASRDMFLDDQGNPDSKKSLTSHLASGTPGTVAGFSLALEKYGTMPLNKVVQPAIKLARDGFVVNDALADDLKTYGSEVIPNHENSKAIFWKDGCRRTAGSSPKRIWRNTGRWSASRLAAPIADTRSSPCRRRPPVGSTSCRSSIFSKTSICTSSASAARTPCR